MFLPGFRVWTLAFTSSLSCGVKLVTFVTGVLSGTTGTKSLCWAVTVVCSDGLLSPFVAVAVTWLLSLTPSSGIDKAPVLESTVTPSALSDDDHVPFLALTTVTIFWALFSSI